MKNLFRNIEYKLETAVLDENGDFSIGLTVTYEIIRSSDGSFITSGNTSENNGIYFFTYTFTENGNYRLKFITPNDYENGFKSIYVTDEYANQQTLTGLTFDISEHRAATEERIKLILGLTQENFRIKDHVYNANNALESATIRIYNNATDCNNDINPFAEYSMSASYDGVGRLINYKVIKN